MNTRFHQLTGFIRRHNSAVLWLTLATLAIVGLMLFRLASNTSGFSSVEQTTRQATYGWHGMSSQPSYLPLNLVRSAVFVLAGNHDAWATRLPNTLFGLLTILLFAVLIKYWHGNRTAILATALFACSAWLLHVSRLASNDVLYLMALPLLLVVQLLMLKASTRAGVFYGSLAVCGLLLYIPGLIWLVLLSLYWQRAAISQGWKHFSKAWQRLVYVAVGLIWLPLLVMRLTTSQTLAVWLGLPAHLSAGQLGRQLVFVPVHLFGRGPMDPQRWLGHAPILDVFTLVAALAGIWFYATHRQATRSRVLVSYAALGLVLIGLGGSVSLSLLVPMLYILAATGIAYLLHDWLAVFPRNPVARKLGISLIVVAVAASCIYNLRAYFVAWPHNRTTLTTFSQPPNSGRIKL